MKNIRLYATLILLLGFYSCQAFSVLSGSVKTASGEPVSGALILQSDSDSIIYTNTAGEFTLQITSQLDFIRVLAPGYQPVRIVLPYQYDENLVIYLSPLPGGNEEFKAHEIIRRAQIQRPVNEKLFTSFKALSYQKTSARIEHVPFDIWQVSGGLIPAKSDTGLAYWSERTSRLIYYDESNFDDSTIAFQAAGAIAIPSFNDLEDLNLNFYGKHIRIKERRYREYYSPLFLRSLRLYKFTALGTFYDGDRKVFRIRFEPKKAGVAAFKGTMELYDSTFTLRSIQLKATAEQHLELVDSIEVTQFYFYHNNKYRRSYQKLSYYINLVGFAANYKVESYYSDFEYLSEKKKLDQLIYHFDSTAVTHNDNYWMQVRPVKLREEKKQLLPEGSLNALFKEDYSSLTYLHNKLYPLKLFYSRYERRENNYYLNFAPLFYGVGYNTVEGPYFNYSLPVRIFEEQREWLIIPGIRYGFSDNRFKGNLHTAYIFDLLEPKKLILEGGRSVRQFNEQSPILPLINTFYSLFTTSNYLKLFGKDYITAGFDHELINGLELNSRLEYAWRYPLYNTTDFHITGDPENFTPNNPSLPPVIDSTGFEKHQALSLQLDFVYQFGQQHKVINGRKVNMATQKPSVYVNFRSGIPSGISHTNYAFLSAGVSFVTRFGNPGYSQWDFSGGGFLNKHRVPFMDYKHFNGEQTFFLHPTTDDLNNIKRFSTLRYYDYSTVNPYVEAHYEHNFDGYLLSKINFTRRLQIHSFTGFNYLHSFDDSQFLEFFIGFDNILSVFRLQFAGTLSNFQEFKPLIRIGVDFNYLYYYQNTK